MAIPMFLAMTEGEWQQNQSIDQRIAWMACHFSPYSTGLSNRPRSLPSGSMLILNDRTPIFGHDSQRIAAEISEIVAKLECESVLLDFQRPGEAETAAVTEAILHSSPCPVAVTEPYALNANCAVFLPPIPPIMDITEYLSPWAGREIWLEMSSAGSTITVTKDGCRTTPLLCLDEVNVIHHDTELLCHYDIKIHADEILFRLWRTNEDLRRLLETAKSHGVTRAVGLFQELG